MTAPVWAQPPPQKTEGDGLVLRDYPDEPPSDAAAASASASAAAVPVDPPSADPSGALPTPPPVAPRVVAPAPPPPAAWPRFERHADGTWWVAGPDELPYEEGQPVPYGYEPAEQPGPRAAIIAGAIVLPLAYLVSVQLLLMATLSSDDGYGLADKPAALGLIPVVGPFILVGMTEKSGNLDGAHVGAGLGQVVGVGLLVLGLALSEERLVKREFGGGTLLVRPGSAGFTIDF